MIGITGGIGSGKSTIAQELAQRGYTVYDCDSEAKRIIVENAKVKKAIIDLLGEGAFIGNCYNTRYVSRRVFENKELLAALNAIVHPAVAEDIIQKQPDFVESAILYEAGLDKFCDKVIVVEAPEEIRIARTIARGYNVRARIHAQKLHKGDISVLNDGKKSIQVLVDEIEKSL